MEWRRRLKVLLDTHALIWWLEGSARLSRRARDVVAANADEVYVSAVSAWEMATKFRQGRLPGIAPWVDSLQSCIQNEGFQVIPVTVDHAQLAGLMDGMHKDPFDRMLVAQAVIEGATLVSRDAALDTFGITRLW